MKYPFQETRLSSNQRRRIFSNDVPVEELTWHRDASDRIVEVVSSRGWYLQFDNELPVCLRPGDVHKIPAKIWHRVIRRAEADELIVEITDV